ncbi:MFS general substrate transporter [Aspergillus tubingensis]|uniref:MFS general substrate transporter n=1 Tax=Aspergillus tubingensis TaxID=5068 RepID=UPI001579C868|nr:MFS general substrate transporter [Aspergillus tubingensis]GFN18146.1 MFS general substrate transporter [Aspergillus tubingensis]
MDVSTKRPITQGWRSSSQFVIVTACLAMFTESLLAGFPVPMLPYMLEERLHNDPSQTTSTTNSLLSLQGLAAILAAPSCAALFDTISNQKIPLYLALVLCLAGTALFAITTTSWVLYLGRILQAVAASAAWLACTTMLTEVAGSARAGAMLGLSMSFSTLGTVSGPMFGGVLLGWFGYWPAWSLPMALLILDMIARFVMIQPDYHLLDSQSQISLANRSKICQDVPESSPFLPQSPSFDPDITTKAESDSTATAEYRNYYTVMLQDAGMWAAVLNTMSQAALRTAFNATLPVYLRDTFNWGPSSVGAIFFALQVPVIFLPPLFGHLRDRVGIRYPTAIGWALLCPLMCYLGVPGRDVSQASGSRTDDKVAFIVCICAIGLVMSSVQGAGSFHMRFLLEEVEKDTPTLFGPNGGRARCFALVSISFNVGLMLGPVVTGFLFESAGYYYMNIVLGVACLGVAVVTFMFC